jgi:Leucine Rich repeat
MYNCTAQHSAFPLIKRANCRIRTYADVMLAAYLSCLLCLVVGHLFSVPALSLPEKSKPIAINNTSVRRQLHFPPTSVGTLTYGSGGKQFRHNACGDISIPGDAQERTLQLSFDAAEKPVFLDKLAEDDIQNLIMSNTAVKDDDCHYLRRLKGLNRVEMAVADITDLGVKQLQDLPALAGLDLSITNIGDTSMSSIARIKSLRYLKINRTKVTDHGLALLKNSRIESLYVQYDSITDTAIATIVTLSNLQKLDLDGTHVTDAGVTALLKLKKLTNLRLSNLPQVTDKSLPAISKMTNLKVLFVGHNGISAPGVQLLKKNLPQCKVITDRSKMNE